MEIAWRVSAVTDPGLKRKENQDNFYLSPDQKLMVVADGMGGMKGGSRASRITVDTVAELWNTAPPFSDESPVLLDWLADAAYKANEAVFQAAAADPAVKDMGTTIVAAIHSRDGNLNIVHVGDSRAYMVRDEKAKVLTTDHSIVMEMLAKGKMSEDQLKASPFKHYLSRCIGHKKVVEADKTPVAIKPGDWIILASDGLSAVLKDHEIGEIASTCDSAQEVCNDLLSETLARGAPDNVTIIVASYVKVKEEAGRAK